MKKIFSLCVVFLFLTTASVRADEQSGQLGIFKVTDSFCQNFSKMSAILNAFQVVQWPVAGFPGIVMGLTQRTSIVHDLCDFLTQLQQLEGVNAIFFTANYLNELTGKKWDHHLQMADKTWNLANTVYDFDNGQMRPGALTSESTAREMNDWMEESYKWYNKSFNGTDAEVKHRAQRENEMQQFAQLSYQRAVLQDATNCPSPPEDNPNYGKIYTKEVKPAEIKRDDAKEDVEFYRGMLVQMGPKFMNNDGELREYLDQLEKAIRDGIVYKMTESKTNESSFRPGDETDNTEFKHPKKEKKTITRKYYKYSVSTEQKIFNDFRDRWNNQWSTWVTAQWTSQGSRGALTGDAKLAVEADFKDLNSECQPNRLARGLNSDAPDFDKQRDKLVEECRANTQVNQKKAENLFEYYVTKLQNALYNLKYNNAVIWSVESRYAGIHRMVAVKSAKTGEGSSFQQEQVACSETLEPAEMQYLQVKQQNVNNGLTQVIAEQTTKQTAMQEAERSALAQQAEESERKRLFIEQKNKEMSKSMNNDALQSPVRMKGGF